MKLAVVRIRGSVNVPREYRRIMEQLGIPRPNNVVLVEDNDTYKGMLQKIRHLVTFGQPSVEVIDMLLRKRGEVQGYGKLTDQYVADHTGFSSIKELAEAIHRGEANVTDVPLLKRTFRCSPPSKGYEGIKKPFEVGGAFGDRGEEIDSLLKRMI